MKTEFDDALRGIYHECDEVRPEETTNYKQIGTQAVCALIAGLLSILGFVWIPFIFFALGGIVLGFLALKKILNAPEEIGGFALTSSSLILSFVVLVSASIWQTWHYFHSVPSGYTVVDFNNMALNKGKVSEEILALDGMKVYIQGFMYPTNRQSGIENFTMVRTIGHCKFCSPGTNPADMIAVELEKGMSVDYRANKPIWVGGILHITPDFKSGEIPYFIEGTTFR